MAKAPKTTASNADVATDENKEAKLATEKTENQSDIEVGAGEPAEGEHTGGIRSSIAPTTATATENVGENGEGEPTPQSEQLRSPETEDGERAYDHSGGGDDDASENGAASIDTGNGSVVTNGQTATFVQGAGDGSVGGDGVTGKSNDGETYRSNDGATGADTHAGGLGIGTTPQAPTPQTADALVASIAAPAKVEKAVLSVLDTFKRDADKAISPSDNLFDNVGMARADLPALAAKLNDVFYTALTVGEAQNFLLVRDVQNMMKRKLAVAATVSGQ